MMSPAEMRQTLNQVSYGNWIISLFGVTAGSFLDPYIQVSFQDSEINELQKGRKWKVSPHMTKSELVLTVFKAVLTAEEHETRERFRYKEIRIFSPHIDVDVLANVAKMRANLDLREEA